MQKMITPINKYKIISGSVLKLIAIIAMFIDHFALIFYSSSEIFDISLMHFLGKDFTIYYILRKIGRLAFPIFCFLVAEGIHYTKNFKKYMITFFIFALISEIPFNLMMKGKIFFLGKQNVYFTLLLGCLLIYILRSKMKEIFKFFLVIFMIIAIPYAKVDYGLRGVILIALLYLFREKKIYQIIFSVQRRTVIFSQHLPRTRK